MYIHFANFKRKELIDKILKQEDKITQLENELNKYKNENTPSSANKHLKSNTIGKKSKKNTKRGALFGHFGKTKILTPTKKIVVDDKICPKCNSSNIIDKEVRKRVYEEIPEPIIPEVIETEVHIKKCKNCNHNWTPKSNSAPLKGNFGLNLMVLVVFIKFILRGVLRKSSSFLDLFCKLKITPASVNAIINRVADVASEEYDKLIIQIRNSTLVYVDETSFSVLGKNQWVWVFKTENHMLLVIRPSRGSDVLKEILGENYNGTVVCDCWRAYNKLESATLQRCWSHLLRKSKKTLEYGRYGLFFHKKLKKIFKEIKDFNLTTHTKEERVNKYNEMIVATNKLLSYYSKYPKLKKVLNYIGNNLENWFNCLLIEGVEPTNNFAEQAIRETVVVRKIIGAFRSEKGKEDYSILASLIATWQLQKLDIRTQLKTMLQKKLCLS